MKLSLGTAQFGSNYGVCNKSGIIKKKEIKKILSFCKKNKIKNLDTAQGYGKCHKVLGLSNIKNFQVTTKVISTTNNTNIKKDTFELINSILKELKIQTLHSLLIHDISVLNGSFGKKFYLELLNLKKQKKITKIGVSVYTVKELEKILKQYKIDIVNIPLSIANSSFLKNDYLKKLKLLGIEIHVRSIFLQGLLLNTKVNLPKKLSKLIFFSQWRKWLKINKYNPLEASLTFVKNIKEVDKIVVGIDNLKQLKDIVKAYRCNKKFKLMNFQNNQLLRNPSKW